MTNTANLFVARVMKLWERDQRETALRIAAQDDARNWKPGAGVSASVAGEVVGTQDNVLGEHQVLTIADIAKGKSMTMTGLQRVGIVLSLVWAVSAGIYTRNADIQRAEDFANWSYKVCSDSKALRKESDLSSCDAEKLTNIATFMNGSNGNVAFAALAPIPVAWVAVFILLFVWRIQVAGIRAAVPWQALSWRKKLFTVFCGLSGVAAIGLALLDVMNLYVDAQVPVALPPKAMVSKSRDGNLVQAHGTWIRPGSNEGSVLGFPLQTSVINCDRTEQRCTEARASVSGNLLHSEVVDYSLDSWTDSAIVLKLYALCFDEVFTIDLNTKTVTGAGHRSNKGDPSCMSPNSGQETWSYRLEDGFPVYWELRQKARPLPLRLIHALFNR